MENKNDKKPKDNSETVRKMIRQVSMDSVVTLDFNYQELTQIPSNLLSLHQLEHLYLKGNMIQTLPSEFFVRLRNLMWLDLRNNRLQSLPISIGQHKCLKTLLLSNNNLEHIPAELGLIKSLKGLNLVDNPLVDPPQDVVEKGVMEVKAYLLRKLGFKETAKKQQTNSDSDEECSEEELQPRMTSPQKSIIKEKWRDSNGSHSRSYSKRGVMASRDVSLPQAEACSTLPHGYDGTCNIYGPHSVGTPCWFIHRPWTTGVYFTKANIKTKKTLPNRFEN